MNDFVVLIIGAFLLYIIYNRYTCKGGGECEENDDTPPPRKPFWESDYCIENPDTDGCQAPK